MSIKKITGNVFSILFCWYKQIHLYLYNKLCIYYTFSRYFTRIVHNIQIENKTIRKFNMSKNSCLKSIPCQEYSYIISIVVIIIIFFFHLYIHLNC